MKRRPDRESHAGYTGELLALLSMTSVQTGAGLSSYLFERFTAAGTTWIRLCWAAVALWVIARPRIRGSRRRDLGLALLLGAISGLLTLLYFEAVVRIPLGTATTLEFLGPLAVAFAGLRRRVDVLWPVAAVSGVLALARPWSGAVNLAGVSFGLSAAVGWACYIVLTKHVGTRFTGLSGLAVSMVAAAFITAPFADVPRVLDRISFASLALSAGAALLLPILPYAAEMVALRRVSTATFGTLMSLEPAIGTVVGLVLLGQRPAWPQALGIGLVVLAGIGAVRSGAGKPPERTPRADGNSQEIEPGPPTAGRPA